MTVNGIVASALAQGAGGGGGGGSFFGGGMDWLLPGLGFAGGALDSLFGGDDRRLQMELLGKGTGTLDYALGRIPGFRDDVLQDIDAANMMLDDIEPSVLEGIDEAGRIRIAQQIMRDQQEADMEDQRLAAAGLDATTVAPGVARGRQYGQSQTTANVAAEFQGLRANALMQARGMAAEGRFRRAGAQERFADRSLGLMRDKAQMYFGTQTAPEGPGFGAIGASIGEGILTSQLLRYLRSQ